VERVVAVQQATGVLARVLQLAATAPQATRKVAAVVYEADVEVAAHHAAAIEEAVVGAVDLVEASARVQLRAVLRQASRNQLHQVASLDFTATSGRTRDHNTPVLICVAH
jgi:hypothetical protein